MTWYVMVFLVIKSLAALYDYIITFQIALFQSNYDT